jgi:hypothetical protein
MLKLLFSGAGLIVGAIVWIKCAIIGGEEFLICPIRPLAVALIVAVLIAWCFRGIVKEHPVSYGCFCALLWAPFAVHSFFALF